MLYLPWVYEFTGDAKYNENIAFLLHAWSLLTFSLLLPSGTLKPENVQKEKGSTVSAKIFIPIILSESEHIYSTSGSLYKSHIKELNVL